MRGTARSGTARSGTPRCMQIAFLMAAHQRLGAEACGQWQRHMAEQHCADDVLRLILEKLMVKRGVIRNEQNNIVVKSASIVIGQGQLKDPRAIALSEAPGGKARIMVADAGSHSIKVFQQGDGGSFVLLAEITGRPSSDFPGLNCPLCLAVTHQGQLVVLHRGQTEACVGARTNQSEGSIILLEACGTFVRTIVPDTQFERPFTISCDSVDRITLLHRTGLALFDLYPGGENLPRKTLEFPPSCQTAKEDGEVDEREDERRLRVEMEERILKLTRMSGTDDQVQVLKEELEALCQRSQRKRGGAGELYAVSEASGILQLSGPCGVATDGIGRVIVLDWARERMQLLTADGDPLVSCALSASGVGGGYTHEDMRRGEMFLEPCELIMDDLGNVAVLNFDIKAVVVYFMGTC